MPPFLAYHGLSAAEHQQRVDTLSVQGFRPISLGVSGDPANAKYAAVWVQRDGPLWWAVHGLNADEYQAKFNELVAQGYAPVLVSATGPVATATFTALFERGVTAPWFARHGLRWGPDGPDTIGHENDRALKDGFIPRALAVYGTPGDRRFAGVWHANTRPTPWSWWFVDAATYQRVFDAERDAGVRPSWISAAPDTWQLSVFRDDHVGDWAARHGISSDDYQAEFNTRTAEGLLPLVVQAGGNGHGARYSSVFAASELASPKQTTVTGTSTPGLTGLDEVVLAFMKANAIRAGTLAVLRSRTLLVHRGYTYAENGYRITQPHHRFRIASLSKLLTCAAIDRLVSTKRLTWATQAYPLLGITGTLLSDQQVDPAVDTITVQQLVNNRGGLNRARVVENGQPRDFQPNDELRTIAARLDRTTPVTRGDLVRYMHGEEPDFPPGTQESYSNFGYVLLTSVVEAASGRPYIDFLRQEILAPYNLQDLWVGATALGGAIPDEVFYENPGAGLSVLQPAANVWAPAAYGGAFALENSEGSGGLVSTAATIARLISHYAVWGVGGRMPGFRRYGKFDGTTSGGASCSDGADFAYLFNRRVTDNEQERFTNALEAYLTAHLR